MQVRRTLCSLAVVALLAAGCGADELGPGELELTDLEGTWTIEKAEYTSDDESERFDLIEDLDATGTAIVANSGAYQIEYHTTANFSLTENGTIELADDAVFMTAIGGPRQQVDARLKGDELTIRNDVVRFDFDGTGPDSDQDAVLELVLKRQRDD